MTLMVTLFSEYCVWNMAFLVNLFSSVPNYCQSVSPKQTTLEEDRELFKNFSSILCLWFEIQAGGLTTFLVEFWTLYLVYFGSANTFRCTTVVLMLFIKNNKNYLAVFSMKYVVTCQKQQKSLRFFF